MTVSGENAKYWTSEDATLDERLIIGLLYLLSAIIFLILQISTIIVFISYKDFRAHLCYRVMLFISMADSIQLVIHAYGGIITLFNNSFNTYLEKMAGGLANSLSLATWPLCLVLALNRMLVFLPKKMRERRERLLFNWLIGISLLHGFPFMAIYLTPHSTLSFRFYSWDYVEIVENDPQIWDWVERTTETLPLPYIVCTFFVYLAIFGILLHQRQKVSSNENNTIGTDIRKASSLSNKSVRILGAPKTSTQQQLMQHERRLFFQAKVQFVVEFSLCSIWFWQMIDPNCPDGLVFTVFVNWYWIFYNGFKPLVYLAMNRTIRERLFTLWLNRPRMEETIMKNFRISPHERTMFTRTPNNRRPMPTVNLPTRKAETD